MVTKESIISRSPLSLLDYCATNFSLAFAHLTGALLASVEGGALGHWSQVRNQSPSVL